MDLISEMEAAAGSSLSFFFSGSAAEIIPATAAETAAIAATMTATAIAEKTDPNKEDLTDDPEEPICSDSRLDPVKNTLRRVLRRSVFLHFAHLPNKSIFT